MGFEDEMEEWQNDIKSTQRYKCIYRVPEGTYEAESIWGLVWEVFKHRTWHLFKHGRWTD